MKTKTIMIGAMVATLFVFSMNNANAMDETECDVTPGMTWNGAACVSEENLILPTGNKSEFGHPEAIDWEGKGINETNVNKGEKWFKLINVNRGQELISEIYGTARCSRTTISDKKYEQGDFVGNPKDNRNGGKNCWCQVEYNEQKGPWVLVVEFSQDDKCSHLCAEQCAVHARHAGSYRKALFEPFE